MTESSRNRKVLHAIDKDAARMVALIWVCRSLRTQVGLGVLGAFMAVHPASTHNPKPLIVNPAPMQTAAGRKAPTL